MTTITNMRFNDAMESIAASTPAPGGGTAAALAGVMAASLVQMVANLTIGRKKYASVEEQMQGINLKAAELKGQLSELAAEDARAYEEVMQAYKLPKTTPDEETARNKAIECALHGAAEVPLRTVQAALKVLELAAEVATAGNQNALTDAGVAALMASAALQAAAYNVSVNISSVSSKPAWAEEMAQELTAIETRASELSQGIATKVKGQIS